jgi:hypothetical protein
MNRMRILGLALVAMFAFSAIAATAAMATTTDIYQIEGTKLAAGETREIKASIKSTEFVLEGTGPLGIKAVTKCTALKLDAADDPVILGGEPGKSGREAIEFSGCTATLGGSKCSSVTVESAQTNNELVEIVAPSAKAGDLAVLFTPASGTKFSEEKLKSCGIFGSQSAAVEGTTAALVPVTTEAVKGELVWNTKEEITEIKKLNGTVDKVGLTSDSNKATLNGESFVELASGKKWCAL